MLKPVSKLREIVCIGVYELFRAIESSISKDSALKRRISKLITLWIEPSTEAH